jgi:hypothetical protein
MYVLKTLFVTFIYICFFSLFFACLHNFFQNKSEREKKILNSDFFEFVAVRNLPSFILENIIFLYKKVLLFLIILYKKKLQSDKEKKKSSTLLTTFFILRKNKFEICFVFFIIFCLEITKNKFFCFSKKYI